MLLLPILLFLYCKRHKIYWTLKSEHFPFHVLITWESETFVNVITVNMHKEKHVRVTQIVL